MMILVVNRQRSILEVLEMRVEEIDVDYFQMMKMLTFCVDDIDLKKKRKENDTSKNFG